MHRFMCIEGPIKGQQIFLRTTTTLVFELRGQLGYYNTSGRWLGSEIRIVNPQEQIQ